MPGQLDLSSFQDALKKLEEMYAYAKSPAVQSDARMKEYMRTAVIQAFEYTFSLAHKFMQRFLHVHKHENTEYQDVSYRDLLRDADSFSLITSADDWVVYRAKRNITSHSYDNAVAEEIYALVPKFIKEARFLLDAIERQDKAP